MNLKSLARFFNKKRTEKRTVETLYDTSSEYDPSRDSKCGSVEIKTSVTEADLTVTGETEMSLTVDEIRAMTHFLAKGNCSALPVASELMAKRITNSKAFGALMNTNKLNRANNLVTADFLMHFYDLSKQLQAEFDLNSYCEDLAVAQASFPDLTFQYKEVVPISGAVAMLGFQAGGTHTGAPYACGPCEAIPSSGKAVLNDPEELYFLFREGEDKIARIVVCPLGEMTGPPGFYVQIGGFPMI